MDRWVTVEEELPFPLEEVTIRTRHGVRHEYYRIDDRWYAVADIDRWEMRTSPYWDEDRAWYLRTDQIEAWRPQDETSAADQR